MGTTLNDETTNNKDGTINGVDYTWVTASTFPTDLRYLKNGSAGSTIPQISQALFNYTYTDCITYEGIFQFQTLISSWYQNYIFQDGGFLNSGYSKVRGFCGIEYDKLFNQFVFVMVDNSYNKIALLADFIPKINTIYHYQISFDTVNNRASICINGHELPYTIQTGAGWLTSIASFGNINVPATTSNYLSYANFANIYNTGSPSYAISSQKWHRMAVHHEYRDVTNAQQTAYNFGLIYRSERLLKDSSCVAYYIFDQTSGASVLDYSGNSNTMTLTYVYNSAYWVSPNTLQNTKQRNYNCILGASKIPHSASTSLTGSMTLEFHGKPQSANTRFDMIVKGQWWNYAGYIESGTGHIILTGGELEPDGCYKFTYYDGKLIMIIMDSQVGEQVLYTGGSVDRFVNPYQYIACEAPCTIATNEEFYATGTWDATTKQFQLYKNGIPLTTTNLNLGSINKNEIDLSDTILLKQINWNQYTLGRQFSFETKIGCGVTNTPYIGESYYQQIVNWRIGDVAIRNRALTSAEVLQNAKNLYLA